MGAQIRLNLALAIGLSAAIWLCPFWFIPTPSVFPLLWGGACLGLWLALDAWFTAHHRFAQPLHKTFWLLLASLAAMIAWRSSELQNTLAAALCLASIGLASTLSAQTNSDQVARVIAWGWVLAGLANASIGLAQYFAQTAEPLGTALGLLRQRNQLATLCNIALLALLYLWTQRSTKPAMARPFLGRLAFGLSYAVLTAALAATCSRTGMLTFIASSLCIVGYAVIARRREPFLAIALAVLCYSAWACALPLLSGSPETVLGRVASTADIQNGLQDSRRLLWGNTLTLIQSQPWLGVGWRELATSLRMTSFDSAARFAEQADHAHNLPLHLAAELGVPFTALWFALLMWLIARGRPWQARAPAQLLAWGVMLVIGIHSLLEYPLWYAPFQIALGLSAGLVFSQAASNQPCEANDLKSHVFKGFAGIALIGFVAYAAFDYHRMRQLFLSDAQRSPLYRNQTVAHASASWLFASQVAYAKLNTTTIEPSNAKEMWQLGQQVLHFSPEPRVFQALIEAGKWLAPTDPAIAAQLVVYQKQLAPLK